MLLNPGVVLGGRYEIIEKIGSGGMAVVYRGKDRKLDRYVTIKILREEYIEDEEFIGRFRTEACAAARLSHPNIVRVYDVGEDGDINYIVMEYIHGDTLKTAIRKKAPFDSRSTINVAIQIASALSQAHKAHIVHRDIKPQNILVGTDGVVKVTDFGIARAATAATMTTTANAAGSVHYFSPEQARGGYVDEKSDIYSLGITMFEMITGALPFQGNNSVAIALKHINEELPDIRQYNPKCSPSLEGIIKKATMKKADERYNNISLMLADLMRARAELGAKQSAGVEQTTAAEMMADTASPVYVQAGQGESREEVHEGIRMSRRAEAAREIREAQENEHPGKEAILEDTTRKADGEEIDLIRLRKKESAASASREKMKHREPTGEEKPEKKLKISKEDAYEGEYMAAEKVKASKRPERKHRNPRKEMDYDSERDRKAERKVIGAAIATAVVIIILISVFGLRALGGFGGFGAGDKNIELPDFVGMPYEKALKAAEREGLVLVKEGEDYSSYYDAGYIFWQSAKEGSKVAAKTKIGVKVSLGLNSEKMPDVENKEEQKAREEIISLVGTAPTIKYEESDTVEPSRVISQKPAPGTKIDAHSHIVLIVSKGGENSNDVVVPDVRKDSEEQAKRALESVGLTVGKISRIESNDIGAGKVITQTLTPNSEVPSGSVVNLVVSTGAAKKEETPEKEETNHNGTQSNGGGQPVQPTSSTKYYTLTAPAGAGDTVHVRVVKTDMDGVTVILDESKNNSDLPFSIAVAGKGSGTITCYMDGQEQWSESVNF